MTKDSKKNLHNTWKFLARKLPFVESHKSREENLRVILLILFFISIITFPLGQSLRVILPVSCIPFLLYLYLHAWENSTLKNIPIRYFLVAFVLGLVMPLALSEWFFPSWSVVSPNFYRGIILGLVGMEAVRSEQAVRAMIGAFSIAFFYEGLNGMWQAISGVDFICRAPIMDGRLTGSLGTYRVGNYMAIIALPAFGIWFVLSKMKTLWRWIIVWVMLTPGIFLWAGSFTRTGYVALCLGGYLLWISIWTKFSWKKLLIPLFVFVGAIIFWEVLNISWRKVLDDPRIELWGKAFLLVRENFLFGTGSSTLALAYEKYIGSRGHEVMSFGHPHNIYIQFLVDGGLVGFLLFCTFFCGVTIWSWKLIRKGVQKEIIGGQNEFYWRLVSFIWGGWVAYLITGFSGHDFYRTWWFSTSATVLGILLGACYREGDSIENKKGMP